jgi:hypothetical protein
MTSLFLKKLNYLDDMTYFQNRAILTTKNSIVEKINEHMLDMIPGEEKVDSSKATAEM